MRKYMSRELAIIELMNKYGQELSTLSNKTIARQYKTKNHMFDTDEVIVSDTPDKSAQMFKKHR